MKKTAFHNARVSEPVKISLQETRRFPDKTAEKKAKAILDDARAASNHQTPEQDQHAKYGIKVTKEGKRRAYNTMSTNLDYYEAKGHITKEQHEAGLRLFKDFTHSRMVSSFKSCLNITIGGTSSGSVNKAGMNFQALEAYQAAVEAIHPRYRKLTVVFCCMGDWLQDIATTIPSYRRMEALQRGLDMIATHYESRFNPAKIRHTINTHLPPYSPA